MVEDDFADPLARVGLGTETDVAVADMGERLSEL
jgi:hypothetical protein